MRAEEDLPKNSAGDVPFTYGTASEAILSELDDPSVKDRNAGASRAEREASREKYEDLSSAEALAIAKKQFTDEFTVNHPGCDGDRVSGTSTL